MKEVVDSGGNMKAKNVSGPLVCIVDDDESVRESLSGLLADAGYTVETFSAAEGFLAADRAEACRCLILDIAMLGMSGLDLHRELRRRGDWIPTIFITAHTDPALRARVLAQGAVACLEKPLDERSLLEAISSAIRPEEGI